MSLSSTVSHINGDFSRKSPISPRVFNALLKGFPLKFCIGARDGKTRVMGLPDGRKVLRQV